ncbi:MULTISPECIES: (d)CMP kinase [unclassified Pyramidobacter]|uniref:(d)CMP kinase n=1 Tax=unclassified Pyramidobacter TaxID=2632171 RepID=UPI00098F2DBB|nr:MULTISPECIES: (d)CMP kinase [unclassified Pyramidobacter]RKJ80693.1 (d)CMP kinase [Pyramidobacter sp. CG50-2]WOL41192.1 (d)CMP kinase [Pyramidobacter sp. YE332]
MNWTGVIAIDGPAGAGKSTVAKLVASKLGISYLDTGALYRALAYYLDSLAIPAQESPELRKALFDVTVEIRASSVFLNGTDVSSLIRTPAVDRIASLYSALPSVREKLLMLQRDQALKGGLVADGRDMGTVVFPYAPVKVFLTAQAEVRAQRRHDELAARGVKVEYRKLLDEILQRDEADVKRSIAPLKQAPGAVLLDSSAMNAEQVADAIADIARAVCHV